MRAVLLGMWQRRSWLIPMDGNREPIVLPTVLSDHVLLAGSLLYQAREQRFYQVGPALTPLAGGPPLAPAPEQANRTWWPYHLADR